MGLIGRFRRRAGSPARRAAAIPTARLAPARGIALAVLLGLLFWLVVYLLW